MDQKHVIDQEVEAMNTEMQKSPKLLQEFVGREFCCIFRVPQSLRDINEEAYQPQVVSIGPYHHGNKNLEMIQEHKWRYLRSFLTRMEKSGKSLKHFYNCIMLMEHDIRQSYSESMEHSEAGLVKMMVLDGVFLIELFRKVGKLIPTDPDDPIFRIVWLPQFLMRDFLRIENQIPFFVLQALFNESRTENDVCTLPSLILGLFNFVAPRPKEVLSEYDDLEGKHLLHFFRKSFLINWTPGHVAHRPNPELDFSNLRIQPATKLVVAGVKFKKNDEAKSFLDIKFQEGVLLIPQINLDDFYTHFILNGMIFEQCYSYCSKDITTYIMFLGCLINTSMDVGLLSDRKIIQNYLGTDKELVKFFNNVVKYVAFDVEDIYVLGVFKDINDYCDDGWHVGWAGFKHTYFDSPWTTISAFAAFVLLCLTVTQTFYTVYPYYH